MIDRLTYRYIELEITRRCNLKCAHCMRGDAQDVDMHPETIDAFLDHTQAIYRLLITGGEPFLNIEGMRYFLEAAKKRNVLISALDIVTNGTIQNREIIKLIEDYSAYIQNFLLDDVPVKGRICIGISIDDFHDTESEDAYKWYSENLSHVAIIIRARQGSIPKSIGKGKSLQYAMPRFDHSRRLNRIEYLSCNHTPICSEINERLFHPNQIIILCGIEITAHGIMMQSVLELEFSEEDSGEYTIGDVFVDSAEQIIKNIEHYNADKKYCVELSREKDDKKPGLLEMIQYRALLKSFSTHPNPTDYISKYALKKLDKPNIFPSLLELNGNMPLDFSSLVDVEDTSNLLKNIHNAYCELNNTSPEIDDYTPQRIKDIEAMSPTAQEEKRLYDRAVETRLKEYFPVYDDLAGSNLSESDKKMWSLLYALYKSSVELYNNSVELQKANPKLECYAQNTDTYNRYMYRDFDKLVSFIRAHPIREKS